MHVLKRTRQVVFVLPKLVLLSGKDLEKSGKLWKEAIKKDQPDAGYVDVLSAENRKHVMRVKEKNVIFIKDASLKHSPNRGAMHLAFVAAGA